MLKCGCKNLNNKLNNIEKKIKLLFNYVKYFLFRKSQFGLMEESVLWYAYEMN